MDCSCTLVGIKDLGGTVVLMRCPKCSKESIIKPKIPLSIDDIPIAANEYISYRLMELLHFKGVEIEIPNFRLIRPLRSVLQKSPISHGVFAMDHYGTHSRITKNTVPVKDTVYPTWLYYFDRWIGRLDSVKFNINIKRFRKVCRMANHTP